MFVPSSERRAKFAASFLYGNVYATCARIFVLGANPPRQQISTILLRGEKLAYYLMMDVSYISHASGQHEDHGDRGINS